MQKNIVYRLRQSFTESSSDVQKKRGTTIAAYIKEAVMQKMEREK